MMRTNVNARSWLRIFKWSLLSVCLSCAGGRDSSTALPTPPPIVAASVSVTPPNVTLQAGGTLTLTAVPRDAQGNPFGSVVTWSTSNPAIATVSTTGTVSAVAPGGPVIITAATDGASGSATVTVTAVGAGSVTVTLTTASLIVGQSTQATALLRDGNGNQYSGPEVTWTTSNKGVATVSQTGLVSSVGPGQATVIAAAGQTHGSANLAVFPVPAAAPTQVISAMLQALPNYIQSAIPGNESLLPRNPGLAAQIQAKVNALRQPTLANDIVAEERYGSTTTPSRNGRSIPIVTVFMLDSMRAKASRAAPTVAMAVPLLEDFFATPYPTDVIRIWYGFEMSTSGGLGNIVIEDQGTYESRTTGARIPHDEILVHELSHSFMLHEGLNQFLEVYVQNMIQTRSTDVRTWTDTRHYVPFASANEGVHALLDIYQLIGWQPMANAYRNIYQLHPQYGVVLTPECKQAFVDQAPAELKVQVSSLVARITF